MWPPLTAHTLPICMARYLRVSSLPRSALGRRWRVSERYRVRECGSITVRKVGQTIIAATSRVSFPPLFLPFHPLLHRAGLPSAVQVCWAYVWSTGCMQWRVISWERVRGLGG